MDKQNFTLPTGYLLSSAVRRFTPSKMAFQNSSTFSHSGNLPAIPEITMSFLDVIIARPEIGTFLNEGLN